jgi:hypothetical protein
MSPLSAAPHRRDAKDSVLHGAYLVLLAIASVTCLAGILFLRSGPRIAEPAIPAASTASALPGPSPLDPPAAVYEDKGRLPVVNRVKPPEAPVVREVAPEPAVRVSFGTPATLEFALGDSVRLARPSATAFHGNDAPVDLRVADKGDGAYDVAFAPSAPGRFEIVLSDGGTPVATRRVGVVGVAGAPGDSTDADFLSVDPREPRMRTSGKASPR